MKIALVTGGSAGIGQATATRIAEQGIAVVITYRSRQSEGEQTVEDIESAGGNALALPLDLSDSSSFERFAEHVAATIQDRWSASSVDFLVNNGGVGGGSPFPDVTEAEFDVFYRTLMKGPYFLTQRLLPLMADGGAIVNVGSTSALVNRVSAGYSAYAAFKGAIHTVTPYLAKELAERRIRVNAVAPGTTRTRIGDDAFEKSPELIPLIAENVALGRMGLPNDIADVITFLLSDAARWITGQIVEVSGGERL